MVCFPLPREPCETSRCLAAKLSPHCLGTTFDSQLPSPKFPPKMPPKVSLAHKRGLLCLFQNYPRGEGTCEPLETKIASRKFLSRDIKLSLLPTGSRVFCTPPFCRSLICGSYPQVSSDHPSRSLRNDNKFSDNNICFGQSPL